MEGLVPQFKKKINLKHYPTAAPNGFIAVFLEVNARIGLCFSSVKLAEGNEPSSRGRQRSRCLWGRQRGQKTEVMPE